MDSKIKADLLLLLFDPTYVTFFFFITREKEVFFWKVVRNDKTCSLVLKSEEKLHEISGYFSCNLAGE